MTLLLLDTHAHPADPFDRMLAAQSLLRRAALVTRHAAFGHLRGPSIIW